MTKIRLVFSGSYENLKTANVFAIHLASERKLKGNKLDVLYICETDDYEQAIQDVQESINLEELEFCRCELLSIG